MSALGQGQGEYYYSEGSIKKQNDPTFQMNLRKLANKLEGPLLFAAGFEINDTSSFGIHAAVVEVDAKTGKVGILKYMAGDDAVRVVDETSAEAQIAGDLIQGIGEIFYEEMVYDESGQPIVATFADDSIPSVTESVAPKSILFEFPSSLVHGVGGIDEAGSIAAPPTLIRAVEVALRRQQKSGNKGVRIRTNASKAGSGPEAHFMSTDKRLFST
jgi:CO/xanthine dehydrogenase Mo-binding subunit